MKTKHGIYFYPSEATKWYLSGKSFWNKILVEFVYINYYFWKFYIFTNALFQESSGNKTTYDYYEDGTTYYDNVSYEQYANASYPFKFSTELPLNTSDYQDYGQDDQCFDWNVTNTSYACIPHFVVNKKGIFFHGEN